MSVLVFADSSEGKFKKTAFEVVSYGKKVAEQLGSDMLVLTINGGDASELYAFGAKKVVEVKNDLASFNAKAYASIIKQVAEAKSANTVIIDSSIDGFTVAPLVAVALEAGYASNVVALPSSTSPFVVKRKAFSNKGFNNTEVSTENKVIGVAKNSYGAHENTVSGSAESFEATLPELGVKSESINKASGTVTIADADVVLAVGTELSSTETWGNAYKFNGSLMRVDIDPAQFTNSFIADIAIEGDAPSVLASLDRLVKETDLPQRDKERSAMVAQVHNAFDTSLGAEENLRRNVFETVIDAAPEDSLIVADMTQIGYTGHSVFRSETSGRFFNPTGYGTLGYALPAGIGAKLGAPSKAVIVFVGDGGLQYTLQEMATAAEEGIPIVVVLWNNDLLKQIHEGFVDFDIEPIAVFPKNPDFQLLARSFGWRVESVTELGLLGPLVEDCILQSETDRIPVMIEVLENRLNLDN